MIASDFHHASGTRRYLPANRARSVHRWMLRRLSWGEINAVSVLVIVIVVAVLVATR